MFSRCLLCRPIPFFLLRYLTSSVPLAVWSLVPLSSLVTDLTAHPPTISALVAAISDFASTRCPDNASRMVSTLASPQSVGISPGLSSDVIEDRQHDLTFLADAAPHPCTMPLAHEGDLDALDIPTTRTYIEAVSGPWASRRITSMDAEMAS
ncbi:unnamed protein product [Closterium sp. NIES-54]